MKRFRPFGRRSKNGDWLRRETEFAPKPECGEGPVPFFQSPPVPSRRGGFLVVTLICLVLVMILAGSVLTVTQALRRQLLQQPVRLQAEWLAESALERAAFRLKLDQSYTGETWALPAVGAGGEPGQAVIRVEPQDDPPASRLVSIEAVYPVGSPQSVRQTKQAIVSLSSEVPEVPPEE